jgi:protoporphyrinogen oxidase
LIGKLTHPEDPIGDEYLYVSHGVNGSTKMTAMMDEGIRNAAGTTSSRLGDADALPDEERTAFSLRLDGERRLSDVDVSKGHCPRQTL